MPRSSLSWRLVVAGLAAFAVVASPVIAQGGREDTTPPNLTIVSPVDPFISDPTPEIVVSYEDDSSGVDVTTLSILLDGTDITASCVVSQTGAVCESFELLEGDHSIRASISDRADNGAAVEAAFSVDLTPPSLSLVVRGASIFADGFESGDLSVWSSPVEDLLFAVRTPDLVVTYADEFSGVDPATLTVEIDGEVVDATCVTDNSGAVCVPPELADGEHTIVVRVSDEAGNTASATLTVTIDATPPVITATPDSPANAAGWHAAPVTVSFSCEDATSGVAVCPPSVTVAEEGAGQEVTAWARDLAGNWVNVTLTLNVDLTPPSVTATPDAVVIVNDTTPEIVVTYADGVSGLDLSLLDVRVDGAAAACVAGQNQAVCESPELAAGEHRIDVSIGDLAGLVTEVTAFFDLVLDGGGPKITLVAPADPLVLNDPAPTLIIEYFDTQIGIDPSTLFVAFDGIPLGSCDVGPASATCTTPALGSGQRTVDVRISDLAGNEAVASFEFEILIDESPPSLAFTAPAAAEILSRDVPVIELAYADGEGLDLESLAVILDGVDVTATCDVGAVSASCQPPIADGVHQVTAVIADRAGSEATAELDFTLTLDPDPPQLVVTPPPAIVPGDELPQVFIEYTDAIAGVDPDTFQLLVDGAVNLDCFPGDFEAECFLEVGDGEHSLVVSLDDRAGNRATEELTFDLVIDGEFPTVDIVTPSEPFLLGATTIDVAVTYGDVGSGVDLASIRLRLDGADLAGCSVGLATATCPGVALGEGAHSVSAEVLDLAGNRSQARFDFRIETADETPPDLAITRPDGLVVRADELTEIVVEYLDRASGVDLDTLVVRVDDQDITADCEIEGREASCLPPTSLAAGPHILSASLRDLAGNPTGTSREIWLSLALEVSIIEPVNGELATAEEVEISGTVDPMAEEVVVGDLVGVIQDGTFVVEGVPLREGANTLTAVARGPDGAVGTSTVTVVRDTETPLVVVQSPADGFVTSSVPIVVTGELADSTSSNAAMSAPVVTVNGAEAIVEGHSFIAPEVLLVPGENVLEVLAIDAAGNVGRDEVRIHYRPDARQRIEAVLGQGQSTAVRELVAQPLMVRLTDFLGGPLAGRSVTFQVTRGDGLVSSFPDEGQELTVQTDAQGLAQVGFTLGSRAGVGNHEVTATSPGFAGGVIFYASATPGPPRRISRIVGDNPLGIQTGIVGAPAAKPFLVQVFDAVGNAVPDVEVTFETVAGGGSIGNDAGAESFTTSTDSEGRASASPTLGPEPGTDVNVYEAHFAGLAELPASLILSGVVAGPEPETSVSGEVLDPQDEPVPGVTVRLIGTDLEAVADSDGRFTIAGAPVGTVDMVIDGSTATRPGTWPDLEFRFNTLSGVDNTVGMPIRLPAIDTVGEKLVGGPTDVTLELAGVPGAELTVFANSVTFPDGSPTGVLRFTQVASDKVPMVAPMGSSFMLAWTVQPPGVHFDPPARISIPNLSAAPGTTVDIFSFDHELGEFVVAGPAAVTPDGERLQSLPGFGVRKSGWGGCVPPPPPKTDACNASIDGVTARANGKDDEAVTGKGQAVEFSASVEGRCGRKSYEWDFGDGNTGSGASPQHAYDSVGEFNASVTVTCESCPEGGSASDSVSVRVIAIDLEIQELPEEDEGSPNEEDPGAFLVANRDDDNDNDTPDNEDSGTVSNEDDLEELKIDVGSELQEGEVRLEVAGGSGRVKIWENEDKGQELSLPKTWDLGGSERPPESVFVEGIEGSDIGGVEIVLAYRQGDGEPIEDRVVVTVLDVDFRVLPSSDEFTVSATDPRVGVVAALTRQDPDNPDEVIPIEDAEIKWEITEGSGGSLSESSSSTDEDGYALTELTTTDTPGDIFRVTGTLEKVTFDDLPEGMQEIEVNLEMETIDLEVVPGLPDRIELNASKTSYAADGHDTITLTAEIYDAAGNEVEDGTRVNWAVDRSLSRFVAQPETTNGHVTTATILAPQIPFDQIVTLTAGPVSETETLTVEPITGSLTAEGGELELDLATGEGVELTVSTNASEFTPVNWTTSNGTITQTSFTGLGGTATALLQPDGGCPGPVVVTATVGAKMFRLSGEVVSSNTVWMSVENRFLNADATEDGVATHMRPDGTTTESPYFAATEVTVHGPSNGIAFLSFPQQQHLEAYDFDGLVGGAVPGLIAGQQMTLDGATIDPDAFMGAGSLALDPGTSASIAATPDHQFQSGVGLTLAVRPFAFGSTLINKEGSFRLSINPDGTVVAVIESGGVPFPVASEEPLRLGDWNQITLEGAPGGFRLVVNGKSRKREFAGGVASNDNPIAIGGDFAGNIDELTFFDARAPLPFEIVGLGAAGRLPLSFTDGTATFGLVSRGDFTVEKYKAQPFPFYVTALPFDPGLQAPPRGVDAGAAKDAGGDQNAGAVVYFASEETWEEVGDVVVSFFGGDPQTTAGTLANVAGGILIVGDVGAIVKNVYRMFGFSEKEPNYFELGLSAVGLLTEFAVIGGEVADVPISAARSIIARIGNSPLGDIIGGRFLRYIRRGELPSERERRLLELMSESEELTDALNVLVKSDEIWEGAIRICGRPDGLLLTVFADGVAKVNPVHLVLVEEIVDASASYGDEIGELMVQTFSVLDQLNKYDRMLEIDPLRMQSAIDALGQTLRNEEIVPGALAHILSRDNIISLNYDIPKFFEDLAKVANVKGFDKLVKVMDSRSGNARGFRFELEVAVYARDVLMRTVTELGAAVTPQGFKRASDVDVIAGGIAFQVKRSTRALTDYGLDKTERWIKATKALPGVNEVRFALPPGATVPPKFQQLFMRLNVMIERVPHPD